LHQIKLNLQHTDIPRLQRVLFVCTHNSARSQMTGGLLCHLSRGSLDVLSAGSHLTTIHPDAIRTLEVCPTFPSTLPTLSEEKES
jgi:hypothetical protein